MRNEADTRSSKTNRKRIVIMTAALLTMGGVAYAYWTAGGSGSGSADAGTTSPLTVNQDTVITNLAPGVPAVTLEGDFDNPNSGPVYVTSVTASIDSVTKAVGAPAGDCDATDFTLSNATMSVGAEVEDGNGLGSWTGATLAFNNKATNQDACKGATVNLSYTVN